MTIAGTSSATGIELLYTISQQAAESTDWKHTLDAIIKKLRPAFIFDNVAIYLVEPKSGALEVAFARATGRGRSAEADVSWGEAFANFIVQENQLINRLPDTIETNDRLQRPFTLGIPLRSGHTVLGAMIYIRFGSPIFTELDQAFGQFLAEQVMHMVERQTLHESLQSLQSVYQLFQLQEDFISTLSHEIRNPLGFIKGYTTTLLRPNTRWDEATQQEFLNIIDKETDRLQDLIENMLDSARLQSGAMRMDFQPLRLNAIINDVVSRAQMHHPDLQVNVKLSDRTHIINGDARRLAQVFENLIGNAIKYAPGSPVGIVVDEADDGVSVEVVDQGPGIEEKDQERLFQRFYRVPEHSVHIHGSGLGLFICKQIIDAHQGQISVQSEVGQGTTFRIELPSNTPS